MTGKTVIIAEDDGGVRTVVAQALNRAGYTIRTSAHAAGLWERVTGGEGDLVVSDVLLPDGSVFDLLPRITHRRPGLPVVLISARNTFRTALRASELGAYEYLPKPIDLDELVAVVDRALNAAPAPRARAPLDIVQDLPLVGRSPAMQDIYRAIARLIRTDLSVMVVGESGTGKELVARALHDHGTRRGGPFVAINMAAVPRELIEAELFGHEKGAFTGADKRKAGRFEQAEGGTLFLDEIGDMPIDAQTRLLRVLQEGEFSRIGGRATQRTNVRIIAATHRDLEQRIAQGDFREDLYYRLNVMPLRVPPLRERREDIADLVYHFVNRAQGEGHGVKIFSLEALAVLKAYAWPGNVRELENVVKRIVVLQPEETITADIAAHHLGAARREPSMQRADGEMMPIATAVAHHLAQHFRRPEACDDTDLYSRLLREFEHPLLVATLRATNGNQIKAAAILGMNRNTLRKKIRELGISVSRHMM